MRVIPEAPEPSDKSNPFVQEHRLKSRSEIEEWLERLRLSPIRRRKDFNFQEPTEIMASRL